MLLSDSPLEGSKTTIRLATRGVKYYYQARHWGGQKLLSDSPLEGSNTTTRLATEGGKCGGMVLEKMWDTSKCDIHDIWVFFLFFLLVRNQGEFKFSGSKVSGGGGSWHTVPDRRRGLQVRCN